MTKTVSATELRKMPVNDLRKEITDKRASVSKMKLAIGMRTHKDTAEFRRERKELARMLTVLNHIERTEAVSAKTALKMESKASRVPASKAVAAKRAPKKSVSTPK